MSLISKDFRFREPEYDEPRHSKLRWSLFIIACAAIGVVVANTIEPTKMDGSVDTEIASTQLHLSPKPNRQTSDLPAFVGKRASTSSAINKTSSDTAVSSPVVSNTVAPITKTSSITIPNANISNSNIPKASISSAETSTTNNKFTNTESKIVSHDINKKTATKLAPSFVNENTPNNNDVRKNFSLNLPQPQAKQESIDKTSQASSRKWREFEVKSGDSLARLFSRADIKAQQLHELMKSGDAVKTLRKIFPKDIVRVQTDDTGNLQALSYDIDERSYLLVERRNGRLAAQTHKYQIDTLSAHASGTIESSLFLAAQKSGISQNIIMELASIFGWDIDFALDIRKGDKFTVVYEENYRDGDKISDGNILAAEFINRGKTYRAVRYTNPQTNNSEYFTAGGKSMRKAFLRTPVNFSRISSRFTINRYHPVLHKFRSHKGVDYAAKRGTPIRSAGDGKVIFKGKKGGYGRVVIIQHGTKYTTLYAHLNSYNKKLRKGSKVSQGQTIAYVGSSGLATGPHLHYEFRVNGVHRNPLTVKLPESKPVPKRYLADFELMTKPAIAYLDSIVRKQSQVALADSSSQ